LSLLFLLGAWLSLATADAPEFLLGDLGVRLDLSKARWHMTRWSDFDFEAKGESDPILLYAWATSVRAPIAPTDAWAPVYESKIADLRGTDPQISATSEKEVDGRAFAYVDARFDLENAGRIALRGATTEIDGRNFHLAVVAPARLASQAARDRDEIVRRLVFSAALPEAAYGGTVEADGMSTRLPDGWRALADPELSAVSPRLVKLGLEDLEGCWAAVHPIPGSAPDVMVSCPRGPIHLGVVDEHSFEAHDATLREKLFGLEASPAERVEAGDRTGFLYTPRDGLAFGAVPDGDHVRVIWALGEGPLGDPVRAALQGTTVDEPHTVSVGDQVGYYVRHRPLSPAVLCPVGCCCGSLALLVGLVGVGVALRSRRRAGDEDDE
jgi:hypothetical protein